MHASIVAIFDCLQHAKNRGGKSGLFAFCAHVFHPKQRAVSFLLHKGLELRHLDRRYKERLPAHSSVGDPSTPVST